MNILDALTTSKNLDFNWRWVSLIITMKLISSDGSAAAAAAVASVSSIIVTFKRSFHWISMFFMSPSMLTVSRPLLLNENSKNLGSLNLSILLKKAEISEGKYPTMLTWSNTGSLIASSVAWLNNRIITEDECDTSMLFWFNSVKWKDNLDNFFDLGSLTLESIRCNLIII
ncbi:hypothetical protein WICPIJ_000847 [Wickerhamomyces pijperi]|uniref:Uncharacterized protein n=1 Tax=Wickerhamomyces pijperi TaxID=599730 RepID=A0A9P8TRF8_WICPI|nr:hypothetical protein WICPIJ_000847 [Wickerhamomyces pijperi]